MAILAVRVIGGAPSKEEVLEELQGVVTACRGGVYADAKHLGAALHHELVTLEDLGLDEETWARLEYEGLVAPAQRFAHEVLDGNYEHLTDLLDLLGAGVPLDDLVLTSGGLTDAVRDHNIQSGKEAVEKCRSGNYESLPGLENALADGAFSFDDLELEEEELEEFVATDKVLREAERERARREGIEEILRQCKAGDFSRTGELKFMRNAGDLPEDIAQKYGSSIDWWIRQGDVAQAREYVERLKEHTTRRDRVILREGLRACELTAADLGMTDRMLTKLLNPHPIRYAIADRLDYLVDQLDKISHRLRGD